LQQLVMESLGKQLDLDATASRGNCRLRNKGSTDQHAFVQQLRDGVNNFFVTFVRVLESGGAPIEVEPGATAGDYLSGFLIGTREALYGNGRQSMTITIRSVDARIVGALIALFERAVGLYASLIHINAYHQPGVEAGKKAAAAVLVCKQRPSPRYPSAPQTADQVAATIGAAQSAETIYLSSNTCLRMAAQKRHAPPILARRHSHTPKTEVSVEAQFPIIAFRLTPLTQVGCDYSYGH